MTWWPEGRAPTEPGWYWMRQRKGAKPCVVLLELATIIDAKGCCNKLALVGDDGIFCPIGSSWRWAGPIPEPETQ